MAKAKLASLTQQWINDKSKNIKTLKSNNIKTSKHQTVKLSSADRKMQTVYLSREAIRLLWQNRVQTGENLSAAIESLVLKHLKGV